MKGGGSRHLFTYARNIIYAIYGTTVGVMAAGSYTNQKDCSHLIPRLVPDYFIFNVRFM